MKYTLLYKRRLPHYQPKDGVFFITFRLAFDLPMHYLQAINRYKDVLQARYEKQIEETETKVAIKKHLFAYEDQLYNQCSKNSSITDLSLTQNPGVAELVQDKILSMHNRLYYLYAFTIMPNHVHLLIKPLSLDAIPYSLSEIMKQLKGCTSRQVNMLLERSGQLWMREYWDYWVRNQQELVNIMEYMRNNPVKAGLVVNADLWPYTWINPELWER
ncbi:MAG: transposase [Candidatus Cloacimonas sp.]|jgi:REP element-mobilizing transposase RayT|nr:transposase [Candidatus Cloacimonas sp.]